MIRNLIISVGLASLSCSALYPSRKCREGIGVQECKMVNGRSDARNGYYERFSLIGDDCAVDINGIEGYVAMVDSGCDGLVDLYTDNLGSKFRDDFGGRYDERFSEIKDKIWADDEVWGFMQR